MAATWHALVLATGFGSGKWMFDIFNSSSSSRYIRIYRLWVFNNQSGAVTGVLTQLQIKRTNSASAGSTATPVSHNTGSSALNANTTVGYGRSITCPTDNLLRQFLWSNDEIAIATGAIAIDIDSLECMVPYAEVWNSGYGDTTVEPQTLIGSTSEGLGLFHPGTSTVGTLDTEMEFTDSSS